MACKKTHSKLSLREPQGHLAARTTNNKEELQRNFSWVTLRILALGTDDPRPNRCNKASKNYLFLRTLSNLEAPFVMALLMELHLIKVTSLSAP